MQDDLSDDGGGSGRRGSPTKNFQVRGHVEFHRVKVNVKPPKDLSRNRLTPSGQPAPASLSPTKKKKQYACDKRKSPFANADAHVYDWSVRQAHIVQPKHARRSPSPRRRHQFENTQLPEVKDTRASTSPPPSALPSPTRARVSSAEPVHLPNIHKNPDHEEEQEEEEYAAAREKAKAEKAAAKKKKREEAKEAVRVEQRAAAIAVAAVVREEAAVAAEEEAKHKVAEALAAAERERVANKLREIEQKVRACRVSPGFGHGTVVVLLLLIIMRKCWCCYWCSLVQSESLSITED